MSNRSTQSTFKFSGTSQVITIGAASVASTNAFAATTQDIRISTTGNCWVNIATAPVASAGAGSFYLPATQIEYVHVNPGQKIAVIQEGAATGTFSVAELTR
jgi:hypothetical protein